MWLKNFIKGCLHPLTISAVIVFQVIEYMLSNHFNSQITLLVFAIMMVAYRLLVEFYCVRDGSKLYGSTTKPQLGDDV